MVNIIKMQYIGFLLLVLTTSQVQAQSHSHGHKKHAAMPAGCEKPVDKAMLRCAQTPNVTFDQQGRLWVAWVGGKHVYVSYSDNKGESYSQAVIVNNEPETIAARGENRPKIVIDQQGRIFVSWTQKLKQRFSGHIRFSRSVDRGKSFSQPVTVNDHHEVTSHRFESLVVNDKGDIFIGWLDKRDKLAVKKQGKAYRGAAVYYTVSTDHGNSFHKNIKVIDHSCECCRTTMAIDTDQLPVILWRHIFGKNTRDHALVKFKTYDEPGEISRISYDNWQVDGCPHHGPAISIADDGTYHMAWFNNAPESHGLFYAYSLDQGQHTSSPLSFGNYQAQASHPQVLSLENTVFLAWQEFDGKTASLMMMSSTDSGDHWSEAKRLAQTNAVSDYPIMLSHQQTVYIAWHRPGQDYQLIPITQN